MWYQFQKNMEYTIFKGVVYERNRNFLQCETVNIKRMGQKEWDNLIKLNLRE